MTVSSFLAGLTLLYWLYTLYETFGAMKLARRLPANNSGTSSDAPLVSVIIAAKDEEASVGETIRQLLAQTYTQLEIIAVNDRSTDATGDVMDKLAQAYGGRTGSPPLTVVHIEELPEGWLGKNHALQQGSLRARGELLLFVDADLRSTPAAVADAVGYMLRERADHVTLAPKIVARKFWLGLFVRFFFFTFALFIRPWRANDDGDRKGGMGIGAFNLLTRSAYEAIGTHRAFRLRPDDDLQLGLRVKRAGLRQRLASAGDALAVEWYPSLKDAVRGLEKNVFSGFQYNAAFALCAVAGLVVLFAFPFAGVWLFGGTTRLLYAISILLMIGIYIVHVRSMVGGSGTDATLIPFSALLLAYVVFRSVWLTLSRGGIYWRGTFYPLRELKRMQRS